MKLTPQDIDLFRHNGFVKLPTPLPETQVEALKARVLKDMADEIEPVSRKDGRVIRISNLWGRGGIFQETIVGHEILDPLESLWDPISNICSIGTTMSIYGTGSQRLRWDCIVT